MAISPNDRKEIRDTLNDQEKYILEKLSGDRKSHALHFIQLEGQLEEIKETNKEINSTLERIAIHLSGKMDNANDKIEKLKDYHDTDLKDIKENNMVRIGNNKFMFWTFAAIFLFAFWSEVGAVVNNIFQKQGFEKINHNEFVLQKPRLRGGFVVHPKDTVKPNIK